MFGSGKILSIMFVSICCLVLMLAFSEESQAARKYKFLPSVNRFDNTYHFGSSQSPSSVNTKYTNSCNCNKSKRASGKKYRHNAHNRNSYNNRNKYNPNYGYYSAGYSGGYVVNYVPSNYYYGGTVIPSSFNTVKYNSNPYFNRSRPNPYFAR